MKQHDNDTETFQPIGLAANRVVDALSNTSEFPVNGPERFGVNPRRLVLGPKFSEKVELSVGAKFGAPLTDSLGCAVDTFDARSGCARLTIDGILPRRSFTEIANSIVRFIAVDVIENISGPSAENMKPREPMSEVSSAVNANYTIPKLVASSAPPAESRVSELSPNEFAGIRRIAKEFADSFGRDEIVTEAHCFSLQKQKKEDGNPNPEAGNANEKQRDNDLEKIDGGLTDSERRAYVRQSVERIRRFENAARGQRKV